MGIGPLWRVTRTAAARRLYERLSAIGVTATRMKIYQRSTAVRDPRALPENLTRRVFKKADLDESTDETFARLEPDDIVVAALDSETVVARLFLSTRPVFVAPLNTTVDRSGAYLWRVFVQPTHRNRGIATALLNHALTVAADRQIEEVYALVALDNMPSRWAFETVGFTPTKSVSYYRLFGLELRDTDAVACDSTRSSK